MFKRSLRFRRKPTLKLRTLLLTLALVAVPLARGKSSKLITSWTNPQNTGGHFKKVLVVGMSANPGRRTDFEDALAKAWPNLE